jgi:signal transduction histidine kinase
VQADRECAQPLEWPGLRRDGLAQILDRLADALLEQREQELVLAIEIMVEAAQRLLRAVDDLLDRELARAGLVDQLERGIQEPLDLLLGARGARRSGCGTARAGANRARSRRVPVRLSPSSPPRRIRQSDSRCARIRLPEPYRRG